MKLHILSDVHLEFSKWPKNVDVNAIDAYVTILAGDIGIGLEGIEWATKIARPVVYVMGNHEFYGQRPMRDLLRKAREKCLGTNVHFLENDAVVLNDVQFIGCTLWTDFAVLGEERQAEAMREAGKSMTDYQRIYVNRRGHALTEYGMTSRRQGDLLSPQKSRTIHQESRTFLETALAQASWDKTVVVTHHAPHPQSLYFGSAIRTLDAAYASDLGALMGNVDLWIHGHVHKPADYRVGKCRIVSNPRGYAGTDAVADFNPAFVVEV